jgi:hypothetical protein
MNTAHKLVALALLGLGCGPGTLGFDSSDEASTDDSTTSATSNSETSSTSETSTSETTDSTTDSGNTSPFVPEYDVHEEFECDPFMQNCPDGEKCVPYASSGGYWDDHKCVAVLGDQAAGEPCTYAGTAEATDDCDATSMCWDVMDVDGEAIGTCTPLCLGSADTPECPENSSCTISSDGVVYVCISTCDPILQDCNDGLACYWANNGFNCIFTTENIPLGEPCGFINDCAEGYGCITADVLPSCAGSACCVPWCDLDLVDPSCEALPGTTCVSFFEQGMAPPGYENLGVCIVPP